MRTGPGLDIDDAYVLPKQCFHFVTLKIPKSHQGIQMWERNTGDAVQSRLDVVKRIRARGAVKGRIGHGQRYVPRGLEAAFIYPPVPRLVDQSTSSLWSR